jgi:hypothetical protein
MKTYKIKVAFKDGKYKYLFANEKKLRNEKNVLNYIFRRFSQTDIKEIKTKCTNECTKKHFWELNYNLFFEYARDNHLRVETINALGYEDLTGYGGRTDGKINRFYIGRSTGWIPIYLEILTNRSSGGGALFTHKRQFKYL